MGNFFEFEFLAGHIHYLLFIILMMTGLFIVVDKTNLVKKIIGLNIFQVSVFMFYVSIGKVTGGTPPIFPMDSSRPGIIIGSIFVITIVMGDFITIGVMGGQQIPSVGKIINVEMTYLQFPAAAANAVILIITTLMIIFAMTKLVDIRKEL